MKRPTLLLIASHAQFSYLIRRYSQQAGCDVVQVQEGAQALECLHQQRPDMVLLHIPTLPEAGWLLLQQIRGLCRERSIPILVMSSIIDEARARVEGATCWLWQVVMFSDFLAVLRDYQILPPAQVLVPSASEPGW